MYFKGQRSIAKIVGYCETPAFCIVMKYYQLGSLKGYLLKHFRKPSNMVLSLGKDISKGIEFMHEKGICHLDRKPDNVLLDSDQKGDIFCVLTDFGISQIVKS